LQLPSNLRYRFTSGDSMGKGQQKKREAAAQAAAELSGEAPRVISFGDFLPALASEAREASQPSRALSSGQAVVPACGFAVAATKKGGMPISIEPRNKGKYVNLQLCVSQARGLKGPQVELDFYQYSQLLLSLPASMRLPFIFSITRVSTAIMAKAETPESVVHNLISLSAADT
jgi:hypothetical protein